MGKPWTSHVGTALFVFLSLTGLFLWMNGTIHFGNCSQAASGQAATEGSEKGRRYGEAAGHAHGHSLSTPENAEAGSADCEDAGGSATKPADDLAALEQPECEHRRRTIDCGACRHELGVVKVEPHVARALLGTARAEVRSVGRVIRLTGQVHQDPTRVVELASPGAGRVIQVLKTLGDRVQEGERLAVVRSSEFGEAKAAYIEAQARFQVARRTLEREKDLLAKQISAEADYLDAQREHISAEAALAAAEKRLRLFGLDEAQIAGIRSTRDQTGFADLPLCAPRAGQVVALNVTAGQVVESSQSLFTIADLSHVWVWADLYEHDFGLLQEALQRNAGVAAAVRVGAFPAEAFDGRIDLLGSQMDKDTRTVKVRVQVPNRPGKLRPGMFATVEATLGEGKALVVPKEAVLWDSGQSFVFQHWKEDLWVRRDVKVGRRCDRLVEVLAGLPAGVSVASQGAFMLKSDVLRAKMGAGCAD